MKPSREQLRNLLALVSATTPDEIDCEEFLVQAAEYLETLQAGEPVPDELRAAAQHLEVCPACKEEFDALLEVFENGPRD